MSSGYFDYYVYGVFDSSNALVYIGKGVGDRVDSHHNGRSSSAYLNERYFSGERLYTRKFEVGLSENQALLKEARLIHSLLPEGNTQIPKITEELVNNAYNDNTLKVLPRQDERFVEGYVFPFVNVIKSPNYMCMQGLRFPRELPLQWCDNHYRIRGKGLLKLGCVLPDDMEEDDTLCIPTHCFPS